MFSFHKWSLTIQIKKGVKFMSLKELQQNIIERYGMTIDEHSKCYSRTHVHPRERRICKWKQRNSIKSTFTLLHEIGHCENNNSKMRRCEQEYHATQWALDRCKEYGIDVPQDIVDRYQRYIDMELARGIRKHGKNLPSQEEITLTGARRRIRL